MKSLFFFISILFSLLVCLTAADAEKTLNVEDMNLEELMKIDVEKVSGASRFEQLVTEAPARMTVVTREDIKRFGYRTLADILNSATGFYTSSDLTYSYIGLRGFSRPGDYNTRLLLLVDGHRINDNIYETAAIGTDFIIDVDLIERVEIIRGSSSSLYGTSAFIGVLNVITRSPQVSTFRDKRNSWFSQNLQGESLIR